MGPYRFCSGGTLYKPSSGYRFGYRFRVGPYRFCSNGNPTTLSILLLVIPNFVRYSYNIWKILNCIYLFRFRFLALKKHIPPKLFGWFVFGGVTRLLDPPPKKNKHGDCFLTIGSLRAPPTANGLGSINGATTWPSRPTKKLRKSPWVWVQKRRLSLALWNLPSRELTYPTKREKENHLQNWLFRGYVSSQEGIYSLWDPCHVWYIYLELVDYYGKCRWDSTPSGTTNPKCKINPKGFISLLLQWIKLSQTAPELSTLLLCTPAFKETAIIHLPE